MENNDQNREPRAENKGGRARGNSQRSGAQPRRSNPRGRAPQKGAQSQSPAGEKRPTVSRGAAVRAQKRTQMDAQRVANQWMPAQVDENNRRANFIDDSPRLKIIGLGGMDGGGSKNMMLVEYVNDAVIIDAGNDLSVDLPGINYGIADTAYMPRPE